MFKFQKNKIKVFILIIILLIGIIYYVFSKYYESNENEYIINEEFILHGTSIEQNKMTRKQCRKK